MILLSHGWKCYPTDENIYDFYSRRIIGVVINIYIPVGGSQGIIVDDGP